MSGSRLGRRPLLLEMVSLVGAVVLGFVVTEWGQDRRERHRGIEAFDRIVLELEANQGALGAAFPYYAEMATRLDSIVRADGDEPLGLRPIAGWRGANPVATRSASYSVAVGTGALEHLDFDVADRIALAYEAVEDFDLVFEQAVASNMNGTIDSLRDWMVVFALFAEVAEGAHDDLACTVAVLKGRAPPSATTRGAVDSLAAERACSPPITP